MYSSISTGTGLTELIFHLDDRHNILQFRDLILWYERTGKLLVHHAADCGHCCQRDPGGNHTTWLRLLIFRIFTS